MSTPTFTMSGPGIVTVREHTAMGDGRLYRYIFAYDWRVLPNDETGVPNGGQQARWVLALSEAIIPGCQVLAFAPCAHPPKRSQFETFRPSLKRGGAA